MVKTKIKYRKPQVPDFGRIRRAFKSAVQIANEEVESFAEEQRDDFQQRIEQQDFPSFDAAPLSVAYANRKLRLGLDSRVMIATEYYKDAIKVFSRKNRDGSVTYYVGFHKRELARDHKGERVQITLVQLAWVHEKGSIKMDVPARPHWSPHLALMHARAGERRDLIRKRVRKHVKKKLGKLA